MVDLGQLCGWGYAITWGLAFYPTLLLNYRLKTSDSISTDYMVLNILGYIAYSTSISLQMFNETVRFQYMKHFDGRMPILSKADLFYAYHGLILLLVLLSQIIYGNSMWGFKNERKRFKIHKLSKLVVILFIIFAIYNWKFDNEVFAFLNFALNLAYFKIIISLIKYIPQVLHNYERKSMYGISKLQISLDLIGSFFSLSEFLLRNDLPLFEAIDSNRGKFGITVVTFLFGTIFMIQIYLYGTTDKRGKDNMEKSINLV